MEGREPEHFLDTQEFVILISRDLFSLARDTVNSRKGGADWPFTFYGLLPEAMLLKINLSLAIYK